MSETKEIDYEKILLQFIASYTLADHLGDVANDVVKALNMMGREDIIKAWRETNGGQSDLLKIMADLNIKTLWNTSLKD